MTTMVAHTRGGDMDTGASSKSQAVNKLGVTLPTPGSSEAARYNFKIDDRAVKEMSAKARAARNEVLKKVKPRYTTHPEWANSTYVDGSKFSDSFSSLLLSNSAAPLNVTAMDHLEAQASTVMNDGRSRSIVFSKPLLHRGWKEGKLDRNSINEALVRKTTKALQNTKRFNQTMRSYDKPWDVEEKFMQTIREKKNTIKREREQLEQTYGSQALNYVEQILTARKEAALWAAAGGVGVGVGGGEGVGVGVGGGGGMGGREGGAPSPKLSPRNARTTRTLRGRALQKYESMVSEVQSLDAWQPNVPVVEDSEASARDY